MQKKASELLCSTASFLLVLAFLPFAVFTRNCPIKAASCCCTLASLLLRANSQCSKFCAGLEEEQKDDVVHVMFKRSVVPGEILIR